MKNFFLCLLTLSVLNSLSAFAKGTISSGGDNSTAFSCKTPANVDVNFEVYGLGNSFNRQIELEIYSDGKLVETDVGILTLNPENYRGQKFDIDLKSFNDKTKGEVRAKSTNKLVQVGRSQVLKACKRSRVD